MHGETFDISADVARKIVDARKRGKPVVAVGTTAARTLESAWDAVTETIPPGESSTDLYIYPGYRFRAIDALFTNFHTPESSLIVMVSAFAGRERILDAYRHAIEQRYRFFSYGDAMLIR